MVVGIKCTLVDRVVQRFVPLASRRGASSATRRTARKESPLDDAESARKLIYRDPVALSTPNRADTRAVAMDFARVHIFSPTAVYSRERSREREHCLFLDRGTTQQTAFHIGPVSFLGREHELRKHTDQRRHD